MGHPSFQVGAIHEDEKASSTIIDGYREKFVPVSLEKFFLLFGQAQEYFLSPPGHTAGWISSHLIAYHKSRANTITFRTTVSAKSSKNLIFLS